MKTVSQLFAEYQQEAFRLELLPQYKVAGEWEDFTVFQQTGAVKQNKDLLDYLSDAKQKIDGGKRHIRVRVIPDPFTDYFIFETKIGYIPQSKIGFELNFIEQLTYNQLLTSSFSNEVFTDFWLFDKKDLVVMKYDSEGVFISASVSDDKTTISQCVKLRNIIIPHSNTLSYVLDKYPRITI